MIAKLTNFRPSGPTGRGAALRTQRFRVRIPGRAPKGENTNLSTKSRPDQLAAHPFHTQPERAEGAILALRRSSPARGAGMEEAVAATIANDAAFRAAVKELDWPFAADIAARIALAASRTPNDEGDGRAEFENWARTLHVGLLGPLMLRRVVPDERYESFETEAAWLAWQAARRAGGG